MNVAPPTEALTVTAAKPPAPKSHLWAGSEFGLTDLLAVINPLQHLPIIGPIYRAITGDTIGNVARVVGDGLYGGPIGAASGLVDVAVLETTGEDIGQHIIATLEDLGDVFSPSTPAAKPASPAPAAPSPLVAAAGPDKDPPKLPLLGSATTAGRLAAAAPISPLLAPRLAAQADSAGPAPGAIRAVRPLAGPGQGIAIDVSDRGISQMRATSAAHSPMPVALHLPAGTFAAASVQPAVATQPDFADRMRDGLAKYDALMAARKRDAAAGTVDQLH